VRPLAPSRVDTCNPLLQAHPTWAREKHEGRGIPPLTPVSLQLLPPSRSVSRRPIWAGARGDNLLVGPGDPPGSKCRHYHTQVATTPEGEPVMMGTFLIANHPAVILFDFGASHTFISKTFLEKHCIPCTESREGFVIHSHGVGYLLRK
jgi:hypothetical protein